MNGKTVSICIDGRPSYMDGKSLEALLRSTDGSTIEKFEIMEHPSSKYDASGQGGIINIKTKKNALAGFNGSLGADGGGMYFKENDGHFLWQESAWLNLSYRSKKTNTFLNLYHGRYDVDVDIDIDTKTPTSLGFLEQESSSSMGFVTNAWTAKLGNDWFIDDRNTLGFILMFPGQKDCQDSSPEHNRTVQTIDGTPVTIDNTTINDDSRQLNASANLDMKSQADGGVSSSYLGQKFYQQKLTVGVSWNFGKAQQPLRYRKVGNLEEASRAGSGKTIGN